VGGIERRAGAAAGFLDAQHGQRRRLSSDRATQQAFLEAHEHAFSYLGGVFGLLRYDNLRAAVKKILRGHRREETTRFIAFRSHWEFQSEFCTPDEAHEKG
jgi:transposase